MRNVNGVKLNNINPAVSSGMLLPKELRVRRAIPTHNRTVPDPESQRVSGQNKTPEK